MLVHGSQASPSCRCRCWPEPCWRWCRSCRWRRTPCRCRCRAARCRPGRRRSSRCRSRRCRRYWPRRRQTAEAGWKPSAGQLSVMPSQVSATSQMPAEAAADGRALGIGGAGSRSTPVQVSATSQTPADGRQVVVTGSTASAGQSAFEPSQFSATSHGAGDGPAGDEGAAHAVGRAGAWRRRSSRRRRRRRPRRGRRWWPARGVGRAAAARAVAVLGDVAGPADGRQTTWRRLDAVGRAGGARAVAVLRHVADAGRGAADGAAGSTASAGQLGPEPVQFSATSHTPAAARQTVVAGSKASAGQSSPDAVAGLGDVADAGRGAAHGRALGVGRAGGAGARAVLGQRRRRRPRRGRRWSPARRRRPGRRRRSRCRSRRRHTRRRRRQAVLAGSKASAGQRRPSRCRSRRRRRCRPPRQTPCSWRRPDRPPRSPCSFRPGRRRQPSTARWRTRRSRRPGSRARAGAILGDVADPRRRRGTRWSSAGSRRRGQALLTPSQFSATSQTPAEPRHTAELLASAGQVALEPVQVSAGSQTPADGPALRPARREGGSSRCSRTPGAVRAARSHCSPRRRVDHAVAAEAGEGHGDEVAVVRLRAAAGAGIVAQPSRSRRGCWRPSRTAASSMSTWMKPVRREAVCDQRSSPSGSTGDPRLWPLDVQRVGLVDVHVGRTAAGVVGRIAEGTCARDDRAAARAYS